MAPWISIAYAFVILAMWVPRGVEAQLRSSLKGGEIRGDDFTDADLRETNFESASVASVSFVRANLRNANFRNCRLSGVVFTAADVSGADFTNADFGGSRLAGIKRFGLARLQKARFRSLVGVDLTGGDLRGLSLIQANCYKVNFARADLSEATLIQATLVQADFRGAKLHRTYLTQADLRGADFRGADLTGATFTQANAAGADFRDCVGLDQRMIDDLFISADTKLPQWADVSRRAFDAPNAQTVRSQRGLNSLDLHALNLSWIDMREKEMRGARLPVQLIGIDFTEADLSRCFAPGADFTSANLSRAKLGGAYLWGAKLGGAKSLASTDFDGALLDDADFSGAAAERIVLRSAFLRGANLSGAKLAGAKLANACLLGANLQHADLRGADLSGADLTDADLTGAQLAATDLQNTYGLSLGQLSAMASRDVDRIPLRLGGKPVRSVSSPGFGLPTPVAPPTYTMHARAHANAYFLLALPAILGAFVLLLLKLMRNSLATSPQQYVDHGGIVTLSQIILSTTDVRRRKYDILVVVAVIWGIIEATVGLGLWVFHGDKMLLWIWALVLVPLAFVFAAALIRSRIRLGRPGLDITLSAPLQPGRPVEVRWSILNAVERIDALMLTLEGLLRTTTGSGEDATTTSRIIASVPIVQTRQFAQIQHGRVMLTPSSDFGPTGRDGRSQILWQIKVAMEFPDRPPSVDELRVTMHPMTHAAGVQR